MVAVWPVRPLVLHHIVLVSLTEWKWFAFTDLKCWFSRRQGRPDVMRVPRAFSFNPTAAPPIRFVVLSVPCRIFDLMASLYFHVIAWLERALDMGVLDFVSIARLKYLGS